MSLRLFNSSKVTLKPKNKVRRIPRTPSESLSPNSTKRARAAASPNFKLNLSGNKDGLKPKTKDKGKLEPATLGKHRFLFTCAKTNRLELILKSAHVFYPCDVNIHDLLVVSDHQGQPASLLRSKTRKPRILQVSH